MRKVTTCWRGLLLILLIAGMTGSAYGQRTVTLRLNTATIPDTISAEGLIKVMGAVDTGSGNTAPFTLPDGNIISWDTQGANESTLNVEHVSGDYWDISFQVPNDATTTFKFYSAQAQNDLNAGWEADPNPTIGPGSADTTLAVHFFEPQLEYHGVNGDRGPYDWRPFESKEDSVAVWFRVVMMGDEARADGYNADLNDPDQVVGVRGDNLGGAGPIDWGSSLVKLNRESTNADQAGHKIYSAVAYYPESAIGQTQPYKFVLEHGATVGWEEGNVSDNRTFVVPQQDTTLAWVYYGNTAPVATQPVESVVVFSVDLTPFEEIGLFDRARGDTLWVYGDFNNWQNCPSQNPDQCLMSPVPGENQFEMAATLSQIPGKSLGYKYFLDFNNETFIEEFGVEPPSGWEEGHATGTNRRFTFEDNPEQVLELAYYNDITSENVIPEGTEIDLNFSVDMTPALTNEARPFDPAADSVMIRINDPVWAFTQRITNPAEDNDFVLTHGFLKDPDGDMVYEGTLRVKGPTYSAITYRYDYGNGSDVIEETGADTNTPGRNRVHYIKKNEDGSWPTSYDLPAHTFHLEAGALPFETNPAFGTAVEPTGELPEQVSLSQNYPNPFNPTTTFEYSINQPQLVSVRVFDLLGRTVATIVDGVQAAATYRVTFDASTLSSGVYFYRLQTPNQVITKKMMLVK